MKSSLCPQPASDTTLCCQVAAFASLRCTSEAIAQWKRQPMVFAGQPLAASFFRHAEDQTALALQAMLAALERTRINPRAFVEWGVVAAANFFGRLGIAQGMERYQTEGPWGVSPHLIPHQSLHGISGTISQALKIYGPNIGVGGGPDASTDAFLLAGALLADGQVPGVWLVLTGHDGEVLPARGERRAAGPECLAMVMALKSAEERASGLYLSIGPTAASTAEACRDPLPDFKLRAMIDIGAPLYGTPQGMWRLSETHWVGLETVALRQEAAA